MPRKNRRSQNEPTVRIVCTSDEEGEESNGPSSGLNLELHDSCSEEDQQLNDTVEMGDNNDMEYVSNVSNDYDLHQGQAEIQQQDSSGEIEEIIFNLQASAAPQRMTMNTSNNRGNFSLVDNSDSIQLMTEMMTKCQNELLQNQRELMQTMLNSTNKNNAEVLSSLNALLTEIKNTNRPISQSSEHLHLPAKYSRLEEANSDTQVGNDGLHYRPSTLTVPISGVIPRSRNRTTEFVRKPPKPQTFYCDGDARPKLLPKEFLACKLANRTAHAPVSAEIDQEMVSSKSSTQPDNNVRCSNKQIRSRDTLNKIDRSCDRPPRAALIEEPICLQNKVVSTLTQMDSTSYDQSTLGRSRSLDQHSVPIWKHSLMAVDTNKIPKQSESLAVDQGSRYDSSSEGHHMPSFKTGHPFQHGADLSNLYRAESTQLDCLATTDKRDRHPVAEFREGMLFIDTGPTNTSAENTYIQQQSMQDSNSDRHHSAALLLESSRKQDTKRSNSQVASTSQNYNSSCSYEERPYTTALDNDLLDRDMNNAQSSRKLCTPRQHAISNNTSRDELPRATRLQDDLDTDECVPYTALQTHGCPTPCYQRPPTANDGTSRPFGVQTSSRTVEDLNIYRSEERPYVTKQQSHIREGSRVTRYKPYTSTDMHSNQSDPFNHTFSTVKPVSLPNASTSNTEVNISVGKHYGVSVCENETNIDNNKQTHLDYGQPKHVYFPNGRRRGGHYVHDRQIILPETHENDAQYDRQYVPNKKSNACKSLAVSNSGSVNDNIGKETRLKDYPSKGEKGCENCHECQNCESVHQLIEDIEIPDLLSLLPDNEQDHKVQSTNLGKVNPVSIKERNLIETNTAKMHSDAQNDGSRQWLGVPVNTHANYIATPSVAHERVVKMPSFTGKESWKVWYNRFNTIAQLNKWDETTRLNQLLPRLEGDAGEFVYGELPQEITCNFRKLIDELESRFRMVETHKTYEAQFSKRNQLPGETTEEYAANLKRLYDKAHVKRNPESRREGLLRRFLNGLADDQARFEVEYHKDPSNIDEAVSHVVNYMEARKTPKVHDLGDGDKFKGKNVTFQDSDSSDSEDSDLDFKNEMRLRLKKRQKSVRQVAKTDKKNGRTVKTESSGDESVCTPSATGTILPSLKLQIEKLIESKLSNLDDRRSERESRAPPSPRNPGSRGRIQCYHCRNLGHIQRECPELIRSREPFQQRGTEPPRSGRPPLLPTPQFRPRWMNKDQNQLAEQTESSNISLN